MSYQVLARKWRPRLFREMVGQTHVLQALINALDQNRLHHAYLFTGTRGVGKTTIARILAKCLNCEEGVSSEPCGVCSACREIDEGRFVDLIEVDAASRTKVEDTRELLDNVQYAPSRGRFKVYLIDEVHMLSSHSFNALLKTLEEPPAHVKFLLATTDPQKLPVTILSRCLQFSLKNMLPERVVEYLQHVLTQEQIPFDEESLWLLGRAADGSMRDGLSLTDQAIAFGNGQLRAADVRSMLGTIDHGQVFDLLNSLAAGDAKQLLVAVADLAEQGADFSGVLAELLSTLQRVAIAQVLPEAADNSLGDRERVLELAGRVSAEDIQLFYQLALHGRRDLPLAPDPRGGFEMALLRMLAFRPGTLEHTGPTPPRQSTARPAEPASETVVQGNDGPMGHSTSAAQAEPAASSVPEPPVGKLSGIGQARPDPDGANPAPQQTTGSVVMPTSQPEVAVPGLSDSAPDQPCQPKPSASAQEAAHGVPQPALMQDDEAPPQWLEAPPSDEDYPMDDGQEEDLDVSQYLGDWHSDEEISEGNADDSTVDEADEVSDLPVATGLAAEWLELCPQLGLSGLTQSIAAHCQLMEKTDTAWRFHLDPGHSALYNENHRQRLQDAITALTGVAVTVTVAVQAPDQETPAVAAARRRVARQRAAETSIQRDPLVQALINDFSAQICDNSIRPIDA